MLINFRETHGSNQCNAKAFKRFRRKLTKSHWYQLQSLSSCDKTGTASFTSSVTIYTTLNFENQDFSHDSGYHISVT